MLAANQSFLFDDLGPRRVQADFSGGTLSTDAGALLLRQVDINLGLSAELAQCFYDTRNQDWVDHSVQELLCQRIFGTALGYEDINDHQRLRLDPLLAAACGKIDPLGEQRVLPQHRGIALAAPASAAPSNAPKSKGSSVSSAMVFYLAKGEPGACGDDLLSHLVAVPQLRLQVGEELVVDHEP